MNIVKQIRKNTGLSIIEIARKSGITRDALYKIEKGTTQPNLATIEKLKNNFEGVFENTIGLKYFNSINNYSNCFNDSDFKIINIDIEHLKKMKIKDNYENIVVMDMSEDNMEPTIKRGDILFIDTSKKELLNNKIYIINENNALKVKRVLRKSPFDTTITIKSDNEIDGEFPPYELDLKDTEKAKCIKGQVLSFCRNID